jgi:hypothetical protein
LRCKSEEQVNGPKTEQASVARAAFIALAAEGVGNHIVLGNAGGQVSGAIRLSALSQGHGRITRALAAKAADSVDFDFHTIRPEPRRRVLRRTLASTVRFAEVMTRAQLFGAKQDCISRTASAADFPRV